MAYTKVPTIEQATLQEGESYQVPDMEEPTLAYRIARKVAKLPKDEQIEHLTVLKINTHYHKNPKLKVQVLRFLVEWKISIIKP